MGTPNKGDIMKTYVVHLKITDNPQLNNNGARPLHEVYMQCDAEAEYTATRTVIDWHHKTFGAPMTVEHVGTREGSLASK